MRCATNRTHRVQPADAQKTMQELHKFIVMDHSFVPDTSGKFKISDPQDQNPWFKYLFNNELAKKVLKPLANAVMSEKQRRTIIHKFRRPSVATDNAKIDPQLLNSLKEYYHSDIIKTQKITGLDLSQWLK